MTTETALNIVAGMEVALVRYGSWDASYTKYTVAKVLKNNRFKLRAPSGNIGESVWTAQKSHGAHEWEAKTGGDLYRNTRVVPWDAHVEKRLAEKAEMIRRKGQICKIKERVQNLHYTQPALLDRVMAALGLED